MDTIDKQQGISTTPIIVAVVLLLLLAAIFVFTQQSSVNLNTSNLPIINEEPTDAVSPTDAQGGATGAPTTSPQVSPTGMQTGAGTGTATPAVRRITLNASNFRYNPNVITVNAGDVVRLTLLSTQGMHDFVVEDMNINTPVVQQGEQTTIEFSPTDPGTYTFYCSVGDHRERGMEGTLVVE